MDSNVKVTQLPSIKTHCFITDFSIFLNFFFASSQTSDCCLQQSGHLRYF